ncbi:MAG TPA: hypothetical protein VJ508_19865, partial [Saprospiraceae bacterium]|nr:hypothetical protein [Saprospiraceae bacterium]
PAKPAKKRKPVSVPFPVVRNLKFIGYNKTDSIVLGNYGDASVIARGTFQLSGIVLCRKSTFELDIDGKGVVSFKGRCKSLVIRNISGDCTINLSDLACRSITCLSASGKSTILLGRTRVIKELVIGNDTIVLYKGKPRLEKYTITDNARFEGMIEAA